MRDLYLEMTWILFYGPLKADVMYALEVVMYALKAVMYAMQCNVGHNACNVMLCMPRWMLNLTRG